MPMPLVFWNGSFSSGIPVPGSEKGNPFQDCLDANVHWYMPSLILAPDVDPSFGFAVSQTSQAGGGGPFNVAHLDFQIFKAKPDWVVQFETANPTAQIQELDIGGFGGAVLSTEYTDSNGQALQRRYPANFIGPNADGSLSLKFGDDPSFAGPPLPGSCIQGDAVVALYQDLQVFGRTTLQINFSYHVCWQDPSSPQPWHAGPCLGSGNHNSLLPLGLKYSADAYQMRYTVASLGAASRVVLSTEDLTTFNQSKTQYTELRVLGDLNLHYPSISRAYFGSLSRTVVLIPQRYSIVRSRAGCAATCTARVDSSAGEAGKPCFEFSFVIAPEINSIELSKLQTVVGNNADLKSCQITFPDFLRDNPASTLDTAFKSNAQFTEGADAHTFGLTVTVQDDGPDTPAVANANLFIVRLCSRTGADLLGSISLKLDDGYPQPVLAALDLNFAHTSGTNELVTAIDESTSTLNLKNVSPLSLQILEYALIDGINLTEVPGTIDLPPAAVQAIPIPRDHGGISFAALAQLALPSSMTSQAITQLLTFHTVDVQTTRFAVAIEGSSVDWTQVVSVRASITFSTLPSLEPQILSINPTIRSSVAHVEIPIENALFSLPGLVTLTVQFSTTASDALSYTLSNDFTGRPVLPITQLDINTQAQAR